MNTTITNFYRNTFLLLLIAILPISDSVYSISKNKVSPMVFDKISPVNPSLIKIDGFIGQKIDLCINQRIKKQNVDELISQFKNRNETRYWQTEFWGKWILSAIDAYNYNHDPELEVIIRNAVYDLMKTQTNDGYIGNYAPQDQLKAWDIWGRKYTMLGLLAYYEMSADKKVLISACKLADHLLSQVGEGKADIVKTGKYRGMPSSSVLKPIVKLYRLTGDKSYFEFAKYIVAQWQTAGAPDLINKALQEVAVSERYPTKDNWWSWENGQKAYEMMSCYDGLLDLYKLTGDSLYLKATEMAVRNIIDTEINVAGSGTAFECFYHGKQRQTDPTYHTMETCVTFTWMQLCSNLLNLTANPLYADQIEKTIYNALLASMKFDGSQIAKYSPLEGIRQEGEHQCGMHINCCNANGPRGFVMVPQIAFMTTKNEIYVNLFSQSSSSFVLESKNKVNLVLNTTYPESDKIEVSVNPDKSEVFTIALRIPEWSKNSSILINNIPVENVKAGTYYKIYREWKKGDNITLNIDLAGKLITLNGYQAIVRGPVLLARDSRFNDGFVDVTADIKSKDGLVALKPSENMPENVWMAFTAPLVLGTDLEGEFKQSKQIHFCDFASAGNTWDPATRYRVWIKKTLNVMNVPYIPY